MTELEWQEYGIPMDMIRAVEQKASTRKFLHFLNECCRRIKPQLVDDRSRAMLEPFDVYLEGRMTDEELKLSVAEAKQAVHFLEQQVWATVVGPELAEQAGDQRWKLIELTDEYTARRAHEASDNDPTALAAHAVWLTGVIPLSIIECKSWGGNYPLVDNITWAADQAASGTGNSTKEQREQATLLRDIFGNPFRPSTIAPDWLTWNNATIPKLAQTIYDDRRYDIMPILGDALEDAGCGDEQILEHCRGPGPHVRGCWVVDLILGKE